MTTTNKTQSWRLTASNNWTVIVRSCIVHPCHLVRICRVLHFPPLRFGKKGKGKCIHIALIFVVHARRSVLPAITPVPVFTSSAFTRWRLPRLRLRTSNCSLLFIYLPRRNERLSWPGWLTYSGRFTHISGHPSAAGRAQDREISPVKDQRSTALPRNRHCQVLNCHIRHFQRAPTKRMIVLAQKSQPPDVFWGQQMTTDFSTTTPMNRNLLPSQSSCC